MDGGKIPEKVFETPLRPDRLQQIREAEKRGGRHSSIDDSVIIGGEASRTEDSRPDLIPLTILHTNDLHGHVRSFRKGEVEVGGIAHLAEKAIEEKKLDDDHTILMDAGDITTGTPISDFFKGSPVVNAMNRIGYDVMVIGNHDVDDGLLVMAQRFKKLNATILGANLRVLDKKCPLDGKTRPYIIKEIDGIKVGIIGLVTPDTLKTLRNEEDKKLIDITPPEAALDAYLPDLRKKADVLILLSHLGLNKDKEIAEKYRGTFSLIVGGHSHTVLSDPVMVKDTPIVQAGCFGLYLGKTQLEIERTTKKARLRRYELIPIESTRLPADREVTNICHKYEKKLGPLMATVIDNIPTDLTQRDYHIYREESNLGNTMADIIRRAMGADIGFLTPSSLRCNLYKGDLKVGDIYSLMPWANELTIVRLQGRHIPQLLQEGLSNVANGIAFSGLKAVIDTSLPEGQQVISVTLEDGTPLDPEKYYTIATRDYLAQGALGLNAMKKAKQRRDSGDIREEVVKFIRKWGLNVSEKDGRLINRAQMP